jgi:hypothetical protein
MIERHQFEGSRVLILRGDHAGTEDVCLGKTANGDKWAVSLDLNDKVLSLEFGTDFGLLVDLSSDPRKN